MENYQLGNRCFLIIIGFVIISIIVTGSQTVIAQIQTSSPQFQLSIPKFNFVDGEVIPISGIFIPNSIVKITLTDNPGNLENSTQINVNNTGYFQTNLGIPKDAPGGGSWHILATSSESFKALQIMVNTQGVVTMSTNFPFGLPPLKQVKLGILPDMVQCNRSYLLLVIKVDDGSPACLTLDSVEKLTKRGLVVKTQSMLNGGTLIDLSEGQREGPLFVQTILPDSVIDNATYFFPICCHNQTIVLHLGGNGGDCTETLTLLKIKDKTATFLKQPGPGMCPVCLSGDTSIETPKGIVNIKELKIGMQVWTEDNLGNRQAATILKTSKILVPLNHLMVHLVLSDGRELYASPGHPTTNGRFIGDLKHGNILDNSQVKSIELVSYNENYTYDILPSGPTGFYFANGIPVGSTLK